MLLTSYSDGDMLYVKSLAVGQLVKLSKRKEGGKAPDFENKSLILLSSLFHSELLPQRRQPQAYAHAKNRLSPVGLKPHPLSGSQMLNSFSNHILPLPTCCTLICAENTHDLLFINLNTNDQVCFVPDSCHDHIFLWINNSALQTLFDRFLCNYEVLL